MDFPTVLLDLLRTSDRVTVLTGAGVSQESGLQTFRDGQAGVWGQVRPEDLATPQAFERNPEMVWEFYAARRLLAGEVRPNPGHLALVDMEKRLPHFRLITQNVDGLHQRAGSQHVIELHGNITRIRCAGGCGYSTRGESKWKGVPVCPNCGARLRPDVVWFGENLPADELQKAIESVRSCTVMFSIGTSGVVQPAGSLPHIARQCGAVLVEINIEETPLTSSVDYYFQGKSGEILPALVRQAWG